MEPWWGEHWHAGHEQLIRQRLKRIYTDRFVCSSRNLIWMLSRQGATDPCQVHFSFRWLSHWGEAPRIIVTASCTCAEVFEIFYVDLTNDGGLVSDTLEPWKLPLVA